MTKLHNDLLRDIGTLARTIHYLHDLHFKELALQRGQFIFLTRICENTGINQNDLSLLLKVDKSTTAKAVQKLTAAGYINRQRSPAALAAFPNRKSSPALRSNHH